MHDPSHFVRELSAKMAARSRHLCVLLGAGASRACGLPDVSELEAKVLTRLSKEQSRLFRTLLSGRNLEQALTRVRRIAALLEDGQQFDGFDQHIARKLDEAICLSIVEELDLSTADLEPMLHFAAWAKRADYATPLEVFTVNYDLLIERAFEDLGVAYFDGFVGALAAAFHTNLLGGEATYPYETLPRSFVRLWKLHGSVNWEWSNGQIVRLGGPVGTGHAAAIYPTDMKYDESRRVPFLVLQDRFRTALHEPESLTLISGYSFGDQHLNELIFDAASRRERSEIVAFCYATIPDCLAKQAVITPNLQAVSDTEAIIGGVRSEWAKPGRQSDAIWYNDRFSLVDFAALAQYLARGARLDQDTEKLLAELLKRLGLEVSSSSQSVSM